MEKLYNWRFHFNAYTGYWAAYKLEDQQNYADGMYPHEGSKALFSKDFNTLTELIMSR